MKEPSCYFFLLIMIIFFLFISLLSFESLVYMNTLLYDKFLDKVCMLDIFYELNVLSIISHFYDFDLGRNVDFKKSSLN
jgi:hypothetical protein